jgi:dephospho-CoA kinase
VLLVYVPEHVQLRRLVEGRRLSEEKARAMIAAQMPIEEKRKLAHHVIDNSGNREATRQQVEWLWDHLMAAR